MTRPRGSFRPNAAGRLAAVMLRALAAELADPGRYGRARVYARDGAVVDIDVAPGVVRAEVQGTRAEPYVASIHVTALTRDAPAETPVPMALQIPERDDLAATCTCPDGDTAAICKHALAALLVLADEISDEPELLLHWRSVDAAPSHRSATATAGTPPRIDVLADRLRAPVPIPTTPDLPPVARRSTRIDSCTDVLASALATLTHPR